MQKKRKIRNIGIATICTLGFALSLASVSIPITTILPTSAPIWVGTAMLLQS